ncbi:MAG: nitrate reductase, partial [Desulfobulbus sp.]
MKLTRREVLKSAAAASAFMAMNGTLTDLAMAAPGEPDKWVKAVCRFCGTGCGVMIGVKAGKVVTVKGDPNNHNKGFICLKGAELPSIVNATKSRVTRPYIRKNGQLEPASWDEAMNLVVSKFKTAIKEHGPTSVAYYGSGQALTEESYLANKIWKAGLQSNNVEGNPRLCMASAVGGYYTSFGKDEPIGCY